MDWFRMYHEFASDAKVQSMSEAMQRRLMMLFCLRCSNTLVTLQDDELAFALRIKDEELAETKLLFLRKGFIGDDWEILQWEKRQFVSDSSAPRVKKHREKAKADAAKQAETEPKQDCNVTLTPQIQNRTDTEQNRTDTEKTNAPASPVVDLDQQFAEVWAAYPKRPGSSRADSLKAWKARIKAGATADEILEGVWRYAKYVAANRTEDRFIKQPQTFFGPGDHFRSDWSVGTQHGAAPQLGKAGQATAANVRLLLAEDDHAA
jgi:hypothetical protein